MAAAPTTVPSLQLLSTMALCRRLEDVDPDVWHSLPFELRDEVLVGLKRLGMLPETFSLEYWRRVWLYVDMPSPRAAPLIQPGQRIRQRFRRRSFGKADSTDSPREFRPRFRRRSFAESDVEGDLLVLRQPEPLTANHARVLFYFLSLSWEEGGTPGRVQLVDCKLDLLRLCTAAEVDLSVHTLKGWNAHRLQPCDAELSFACLLRGRSSDGRPLHSLSLDNNHLGARALPLLRGLQQQVEGLRGLQLLSLVGNRLGPDAAEVLGRWRHSVAA